MANVIGNGTASMIMDKDGDPIDSTNRLPVETEAEGFTTWVTYDDVAIGTTAGTLNSWLSLTGGNKISDAKEVVIQPDDANDGYLMVGSGTTSASDTAAGSVGSRHGLKVIPGQMLILAISDFDTIWIDGSDANQYTNIAYFK